MAEWHACIVLIMNAQSCFPALCIQENNCVVMVQEFAEGGDLYTVLRQCGGRLKEQQAVDLVLRPFLNALKYMHDNGIVHR